MMKLLKRVLAVVITLVTTVSVMVPAAMADDTTTDSNNTSTAVTASSTNQYQLFIQLAQGKKLTSQDMALLGESSSEDGQRQWQFFGTLLSNYYAPFSTDLKSDKLTDTKTAGGQAYANMIKILTSGNGGFNFDKSTAKMIAQGVLGSVQKDSEELHFAYCKSANLHVTKKMITGGKLEASDSLKEGECNLDSKGQEPVTYYSLMAAAVGDFPSYAEKLGVGNHGAALVVSDWAQKENTVLKTSVGNGVGKGDTFKDAKRNANVVVAYGAKSKFPAFVADMYGEEITPSVLTLINILKHTNTGMGYGSSMIDAKGISEEPSKANDKDYIKDLLAKTKDPEKYFTFGIPLKLSPFGDLWMDGAESSLIVMPGAWNPMIYMPVNDDGKDVTNARGTGLGGLNTLWIQGSNDGLISDSGAAKAVCKEGINKNTNCLMVSNQLGNDSDYLYNVKGGGEQDGSMDITTGSGEKSGTDNIGATPGMGRRYALLVRGASSSSLDKGILESFFNTDTGQRKALSAGFNAFVKKYSNTSMRMVRHSANSGGFWALNDVSNTTFGFPWFNYADKFTSNVGMENTFNKHGVFVLNNTLVDRVGSHDKKRPIYDNMMLADDLGMIASVKTASDKDGKSSEDSTAADGDVDMSQWAVCSITALNGKYGQCSPASDKKGADKVSEFADAVKGTGTGLNGTDQPKNGETLSVDIANSKMQAMFIVNYAMAAQDPDGNEDIKKVWANTGYRFALEELPAPKHFTLETSADDQDDQMSKDIKNWIWFLLNPTTGFRYKMTLLSGAIASVFVGWHNDMVGASGVGNLPGTTKYTGFNGYVTTPTLSDMEWADQMVTWYKDHLLLIIVAVCLILVCFVVTNTIGMQKALVSMVAFAVLAMIPATAVDAVANISNGISDRLYSGKFTYWALAQHETYAEGIADAVNQSQDTSGDGGLTKYMQTIYGSGSGGGASANNAGGNRGASIATDSGNTSFDYNSQGDNNILLKWQAPKKLTGNIAQSTEKDGSWMGIKSSWMTFLNPVLQNSFSGQTFNSNDNSYLYRDYTDLGNYSQYVYLALSEGSPNAETKVPYNSTIDTSWWDKNLQTMYANASTVYSQDRQDGLNNFGMEMPKHWVMPFGSSIYDTSIHRNSVDGLQQGQTVGLSPTCLKYGLPLLNQYGKSGMTFATYKNINSCMVDGGDTKGKSEADYGSLTAYELMSESPFFWQSFNLYDQGMSPTVGTSGGFKDVVLPSGGLSYFYDTDTDKNSSESVSTGEMKDYLDMKGLFAYFMPYARMGNKIVNDYFDTYGRVYYDGISSEDGHADDYKSDPVALRKYWHNVNLAHLYSIYTPWVDLMDKAGYSKPVTVNYNGKKFVVDNPTDPATYPADRPMVFSKAEQTKYGLKDSQLTEVERKIQKVEEDTESDYIDLLNYYTFNDNVLNTAAAMRFTFNFNRIFSESKPANFGNDTVTLYPQNYELKNFTYDAYLRLIINSSTSQKLNGYSYNDSDNTGAGFYAQTVQNSSLMTALGFIVLDTLAIYVVPVLKSVFIVGIYLMLIILLLATVFKLEDNPWGKFLTTMGKPMGVFFAITTLMAFVVSLFMSSGSNAVTGDQQFVIRLGDPTLVVFAMIGINALVAFAYLMLAKKLCLDIWRNGKDVALSVAGVVGGVGKAIAAGFSSAVKGQGFKTGYSKSLDTGKVSNGGQGSTFGSKTGATESGSYAGDSGSAHGRTAVLLTKRASNETRRTAIKNWRRRQHKAEDADIQTNDRQKPKEDNEGVFKLGGNTPSKLDGSGHESKPAGKDNLI